MKLNLAGVSRGHSSLPHKDRTIIILTGTGGVGSAKIAENRTNWPPRDGCLEDKGYLGAHSATDGETTVQNGIQFVDLVLAKYTPLLANIYLNELDILLTQRGHQFVRYADNCNIYVKSKRAGERVLRNVTALLENRLKLTINHHKTTVGHHFG